MKATGLPNNRLLRALFAVAGCTIALAIMANAAGASFCDTVTSIGQPGTCGVVISAPGCYVLAGPQTSDSDTQDCIQITASNVFLELNPGPPSSLQGTGLSSNANGIHVLPSANNVFITTHSGFSISAFLTGIFLEGSHVTLSANPVARALVSGEVLGIVLSGSSGDIVTGWHVSSDGTVILEGLSAGSNNNILTGLVLDGISVNDTGGTADGILLSNAAGNLIDANTLGGAQGNGFSDAIAVNGAGRNSNNNIVTGNTLTDTGGAAQGIQLSSTSNNIVAGNLGIDGYQVGVALFTAGRNELAANSADRNSSGFYVDPFSAGNDLDSNEASGNGLGDILGGGIQLAAEIGGQGATHNVVSGNSAFGNAPVDLEDQNPNCGSNRWFDNVFSIARPLNCIN